MAAPTDSSGTQNYWFNGQTFIGLEKTGIDTGTQDHWFDGQTARYLFPASTPPASTSHLLLLLGVGS